MNLRDELRRILDERGDLSPELVVDVARDPAHPLHHRFEWDDAIAGHAFRLVQASQLLRVTYRPDPTKPTELRAYLPYKAEDSHQSSYIPTEQAMADPFIRRLVLRDMERDWRAFKKRYEHMAEFAVLIQGDQQAAS